MPTVEYILPKKFAIKKRVKTFLLYFCFVYFFKKKVQNLAGHKFEQFDFSQPFKIKQQFCLNIFLYFF